MADKEAAYKKKHPNHRPLCLWLENADYDWLQHAARRKKCSMQELARDAVKAVLWAQGFREKP